MQTTIYFQTEDSKKFNTFGEAVIHAKTNSLDTKIRRVKKITKIVSEEDIIKNERKLITDIFYKHYGKTIGKPITFRADSWRVSFFHTNKPSAECISEMKSLSLKHTLYLNDERE